MCVLVGSFFSPAKPKLADIPSPPEIVHQKSESPSPVEEVGESIEEPIIENIEIAVVDEARSEEKVEPDPAPNPDPVKEISKPTRMNPVSQKQSEAKKDEYDSLLKQSEAWIMAEEFVKKELEAPASAKFPVMSRSYNYLGSQLYRMEGVVRYRNVYGVPYEKRFKVFVQEVEQGKWERVKPIIWY